MDGNAATITESSTITDGNQRGHLFSSHREGRSYPTHSLALPGSLGGWPLSGKDTRQTSAFLSPPSAFIFPSATPEFSRVLCCFQTPLEISELAVDKRVGPPPDTGSAFLLWSMLVHSLGRGSRHALPRVLPARGYLVECSAPLQYLRAASEALREPCSVPGSQTCVAFVYT